MHISTYGTTCWFCGHPALRIKTVTKVRYRACDECKAAPTESLIEETVKIELQQNRNADVAALKAGRRDYTPVYWSFAAYAARIAEFDGWPRPYVDNLRALPWHDDVAYDTRIRLFSKKKQYQREQQERLRAIRKVEKERFMKNLNEGIVRELQNAKVG